jgi:hypothetical protein
MLSTRTGVRILLDTVITSAKWERQIRIVRSLRELLAKPIDDRIDNPNVEQSPGTRVTERDSGYSNRVISRS